MNLPLIVLAPFFSLETSLSAFKFLQRGKKLSPSFSLGGLAWAYKSSCSLKSLVSSSTAFSA